MRPLEVDEPTVVGPYRLLGRLGSGGMGRVYLGRSAGGRTVAVKIVHPHFALDEEFRARFRREVDAARRVGGAWTAPVLDADPGARVPWVATAYAAGPSLTGAVADTGPLPAPTVRALGAGLAEALTAVHALGLVHRDVKPSNVLLTLDGPLLIDFGIARATDGTASLTSTGVSIGSPGYMSPEQILGKGVTGAADVFSLGAVLAYAATGSPPFPGDSSAALLYKVVHEPPELDGLTGELRELTEACLAKDPSARPAPAEVSGRLAPEGGAAGLMAGGWLPGRLVEQVSRAAVHLLNLEATGGGDAGGASGPVGFSRASVSAGSEGAVVPGPGGAADTGGTASGTAPADGFGPPAGPVSGVSGVSAGPVSGVSGVSAGPVSGVSGVSAGPVSGVPGVSAGPVSGVPGVSAGPVSGVPGVSAGPVSGVPGASGAPVSGVFGPPPVMPPAVGNGPGVPGPRDGQPQGTGHAPTAPATPHRPSADTPADDARPGRLSVSVAAASAPGAGGRGRRVSCTVALAVAGALAAVTVGSAFVFDLLPGAPAAPPTPTTAAARPENRPRPSPSRPPTSAPGRARPAPARASRSRSARSG